jgi:tRNA 2-thiouridine synthesizing protein E
VANSMDEIMHPGSGTNDPDFPHAPEGWTRQSAERIAKEEGLALNDDHWKVIYALQEYFHRHEEGLEVNVRELRDALDESFHAKGGSKYLFKLLPGGPIAQGCRLAGLEPPAGAVDKSFGSVE